MKIGIRGGEVVDFLSCREDVKDGVAYVESSGNSVISEVELFRKIGVCCSFQLQTLLLLQSFSNAIHRPCLRIFRSVVE